MLAPVRGAFRAIAATVVPEADRLDERAWTELETIVTNAMATRPAKLQRQLLLFIRIVDWLPLPWFGRRFSQLDSSRRTRVLRRLQDAPLLLFRRGCWGLRTLILMGFYGRAEAQREIGYRADPRGWAARR